MESKKKKKKVIWQDVVFYAVIIALPLAKFIFSEFIINFNSIKMAFEAWNLETGAMEFVGFEHFKDVWTLFTENTSVKEAIGRSFGAYFIALLVTTFIPVFFAFFVYKKFFGAEFFKVILFMPSMVASIVTLTIFRFIANRMIPQIAMTWFGEDILGLTSNPDTAFGTILFYSLWLSLGGSLLTNIGAMNSIDQSTIEAGYIDGMNLLQEFWHITYPAIYRITTLGFITGIASIFTADYGLYGFFGNAAEPQTWTLGYYFTIKTLDATTAQLPFYAAWGLLISVVVIPVTFLARDLIYKFGPSED